MILGIRAIRHVPNRKVSAGALAMGMANFVHAELAAAGSSAGTGFYVSGGEAETFTEQNDNNTIWQGSTLSATNTLSPHSGYQCTVNCGGVTP